MVVVDVTFTFPYLADLSGLDFSAGEVIVQGALMLAGNRQCV